MSDLLTPLFEGCEPHLSTSHVNGKAVLWVAPYKLLDGGRLYMGPHEGPFRDLAQAERTLGDRLKFTAQHRRDCEPTGG